MSDAREALVALIRRQVESYRREAEHLADVILAVGWTPPGEADEWLRVASEQTRMERDRAEAAEAEVERLREDYQAACEGRAAFHAERDEARGQVGDLRADLDFERGRCARLAGLADKAERQVADLRAILAEYAVTPRGVHNHDIDPTCPETRLPDGSLRGACMDRADRIARGEGS